MVEKLEAPVAKLLSATGLFRSLSTEELSAAARGARVERHDAEQVIVREDDPGDTFYVVVEGEVEVFTRTPDGAKVSLGRLGPGKFFGEQALLPGRPNRRTASVQSLTKVKLLHLEKQAFLWAVERDAPLRRHLDLVARTLGRQKVIRSSLLFRSLELGEDADRGVRREDYKPGQTVYAAGDPADRFYVILSGTAAVYRDEDGVQKLVVRKREGQGFGEVALMQKRPHGSTVIAEGPLSVLSIDHERFGRVYEKNPELRDYLTSLQKVYLLPGRGFATQHAGKLRGREAIVTLYHLAGGRRVIGSRAVGDDIYNMSVAHEPGVASKPIERVKATEPTTGSERELRLIDGLIVGVTVEGGWDKLGRVHQMILDERRLEPWQVEVFRETADLGLEEQAAFFENEELICTCVQVSLGDIGAAIRGGCASADEVGEQTGAGTVCGACVGRVDELIGRPECPTVVCTGFTNATDEVRSFRFAPTAGTLAAPRAGQQVTVQALIDGAWVEHPFALTSAALAEVDHYEIAVKREAREAFSNWLFDRLRPDSLVRVSEPQGEAVPLDGSRPIACFVASVGVAPALAMIRTIIAGGSEQRLHVDYSCARARQLAFAEEIDEAADRFSHISFHARVTGEEGRITREEVEQLLERMPEAFCFVCGPESYRKDVVALLGELGVPPERIRKEEFARGRAGPGAGAGAVGHTATEVPPARPPGRRPGEKPVWYPEVEASGDGPGTAEEARAFLMQMYYEKGVPQAFEARWREVLPQIERTGSYEQTFDEIAFGAKLAWRNSARCIGRLFWSGLQVLDMRHLDDEEAMFEAICEHLRLATNDGNLRALMTVFAPQKPGEPAPRLWNSQLVRYAGYDLGGGRWIGDPANAGMTEACLKLGWEPRNRTDFDILPIVIELPGREPRLFELPEGLVLEVPFRHPDFAWFEELGLRWYAVPAVSEMLFDCGGVRYTMAPFNGWYMGTEIGARNFSDEYRYNMLPEIARRMGLDTARDRDLWRDRALVELNIAVLHSFEQAGVKMVDHHAASSDFMEFAKQEADAGRRVDARWSWVVPPISGSLSKLFHVEWEETVIKPNYFYQPKAFEPFLAR